MTLIEDYVHHGEKQSCQAVEDGYVFVNINGTIIPIFFWVYN